MSVRSKLHHIIFETESGAAKRFDVILLWVILFSVFVVMLESVPELGLPYGNIFFAIEWTLTIIFTIEYLMRIWVSPRPLKYIFGFWGIIDLLSVLPAYLSLMMYGYHYFLVMRVFRLLRVFRILKLARFNKEAHTLVGALKASSYKISIFFVSVIAVVTLMGTVMYVIEGGKEGFTSIPQSIYWAIVTVTTVGYGDMVPHTILGKFVSSICMIIGYSIIAVPTGIVTVAMSQSAVNTKSCTNCGEINKAESNFCSGCGNKF